MKHVVFSLVVLMMVFGVAPGFSAEVTQVWHCEIEDGVTEKQIVDGVGQWLTAAQKIEGGENLEASVFFPVAVATGEIDLLIVFTAPSFEEWGKFWDGYEGSEAAKLENEQVDLVVCPDSALWESVKISTK